LASRLFIHYNRELDDTVEALLHQYLGAYESELDFVALIFNQSYLKEDLDDTVEPYINYQRFRRDIFERDYFSIRVAGKSHIFMRH
jgi:antirestriction protein